MRVIGLAAVALVVAGCGAPAAAPAASSTISPTASPSSDTRVSALSFDLPTGYTADGTRIGDDGELVRSWRLRVAKAGPSCVIVAGEQPGYSGAFPAAAIQAFELGHENGSDVQYNTEAPPIPGTVSGVRQAQRYVFSLGTSGTAPGVVLVRQYLTTDHTLISLNAAGPADAATTCGLQAAVDSLRVASSGDQEPPVVLPTPSVTASPTGTPSGTASPTSQAESTP